MGKYGPKIKISPDLPKTLYTIQFKGAEYTYLKLLFLKSKFRYIGDKIKISSNLRENVYTGQIEGTLCESDWF